MLCDNCNAPDGIRSVAPGVAVAATSAALSVSAEVNVTVADPPFTRSTEVPSPGVTTWNSPGWVVKCSVRRSPGLIEPPSSTVPSNVGVSCSTSVAMRTPLASTDIWPETMVPVASTMSLAVLPENVTPFWSELAVPASFLGSAHNVTLMLVNCSAIGVGVV